MGVRIPIDIIGHEFLNTIGKGQAKQMLCCHPIIELLEGQNKGLQNHMGHMIVTLFLPFLVFLIVLVFVDFQTLLIIPFWGWHPYKGLASFV